VRRLDLERQGGRVQVGDGAGRGLALDVHRDLDLDLLAALDDDEVEVLDDLVHRVLLHVLDERELGGAADLELEHGVRLADEQQDLVARQREVAGVGAVAVEHGGDLAGGADLARRALAERLARLGDDLVVFVHGDGSLRARGPDYGVSVFNSNACA
jgi:hypothetical protein